MSTPIPEPRTPGSAGAGPARRKESDSARAADGRDRDDKASPNDEQPARAQDRQAEEELSREEEREEQKRVRLFRKEGLDSLRPTFDFDGATSFGGYAAARDININLADTARRLAIGPLADDELAEISRVYVRFPGWDEARKRLLTTRVLVLVGDEGSGRRTSALALLSSVVDGKIYNLGRDRDLNSLGSEDHAGQCGYLLDFVTGSKPGELTQSLLNSAEHKMGKSGSFLIITATARDEAQRHDLDRYLCDHKIPDLDQVLCRHLHRVHPDLPDPLRGWLAEPRLASHGDAAIHPNAIGSLAAVLTGAVTEKKSLDEAFSRWIHRHTDIQAERLLRSARQLDPEIRPTGQLQRCAFLVALAVFNDAPSLPVAAAAESLAQYLAAAEYPRGTPHREIFVLRREDCLNWLRGKATPRCRSDRWGEQETEHIHFSDENLPAVLLSKLWREYDAVRTPVLRWLQDLVVSRNPEIRVRAAQAIGNFSTYDFDYVYQEVIFGWAGSPGQKQRYAAAWALEAAFRAGEVDDLVLRLLREWCRSGSAYRKRTAVMAYGTAIGASRAEEALRSMRDLARSNNHDMVRIACDSVMELYLGEQPDQVLNTLQEWLADGDVMARRFSIESFVQIAYQQDDGGCPVLLPLCRQGHPRAGFLLRIWQYALVEDYTRADAWQVLGHWCRAVDENSDLGETFYHLVDSLRSVSEILRVRLSWYLNFWANYAKISSTTAGRLHAAEKE